jgi:hypothetical protein
MCDLKMKLKIGFIVASTLILFIAVFNPMLTFAQSTPTPLDYVKVSAFGVNLEEDFPNVGSFIFIVADLPPGSEILNSIAVSHDGQNSTISLSQGQRVSLIHTGRDVISKSLLPAPEADHFVINYEGQALSLQINADFIPEFPSFLLMFIALIGMGIAGIFYKKKLST